MEYVDFKGTNQVMGKMKKKKAKTEERRKEWKKIFLRPNHEEQW